jgi:transposase
LLGLLDHLKPSVEQLNAAVEQEAQKRPEALRLMTHPGVGPITALPFVLIIGTPERFSCGSKSAALVRTPVQANNGWDM